MTIAKHMVVLLWVLVAGAIFFAPFGKQVFATVADRYWGQYHGPADGCARLESGPGADLRLAWRNDMLDPDDDLSFDGNIGFDQDGIYRHGTLIRADDHSVYFRLASDYEQSRGYLWRLDPADGQYEQWSVERPDDQDHTNPRSTQLFDSPHEKSFRAFHAGAFYSTNWGMFDVRNQVPYNPSELRNSHSVKGSRVLGPGGRWAWKNNKGLVTWGASYYQGGSLYHWSDGDGQYVEVAWDCDNDPQTADEKFDLALIDHAWDDDRVVLFAHDGHHNDGAPYDHARYVVLAADSPEVLQNVIIDSSQIYHPDSPLQDTYHSAYATHTDTVNKLAIDGRYMYAVERSTSSSQHLVCRDMEDQFGIAGQIDLPNYYYRNIGFCLDDNRVYVQFTDEIRVYAKVDLTPDLEWGAGGAVSTSYRQVYHNTSYQFGMCSWTSAGTECYPQQTIATDGDYIYFTTDSQLAILNASDGSTAFEHTFSSMPQKATNNGTPVTGIAGDLVLTPSAVVVSSRKDSSVMWCFRPAVELILSDDGEILEGSENGEQIGVELVGEDVAFVDPLDPGNWTFENLPDGVTVATVSRTGDRTAVLTLQGDRETDYDEDILNMNAAAFVEEVAGAFQGPVEGRGVTFTALTSITDAALAHDNSYVDIVFSRPVFSTSDLASGVAVEDFQVAVESHGGAVDHADLTSATDIYDNPLAGGETVVRLHLSLNDDPDGIETIEIAVNGNEIFDYRANAVPEAETAGPLGLFGLGQVKTWTFRQGADNYSAGRDAWYQNETNYGSSSYLRTWTNTDRNTLVAFDDIASVFDGSDIIDARLWLYTYSGSYLDDDDVLHVYPLTHDWTESGVTLTTSDGVEKWPVRYREPFPAARLPMSAISRSETNLAEEQWISFDVTDTVASWLAGSPNYGFMIAVNQGKSAALYWHSNEYTGDESLRPTLTVHANSCIVHVSLDGLCDGNLPCYDKVGHGARATCGKSGAEVMIAQGEYSENVDFDLPRTVTLTGGWDDQYAERGLESAIKGCLTISKGTLVVDGLVLRYTE